MSYTAHLLLIQIFRPKSVFSRKTITYKNYL